MMTLPVSFVCCETIRFTQGIIDFHFQPKGCRYYLCCFSGTSQRTGIDRNDSALLENLKQFVCLLSPKFCQRGGIGRKVRNVFVSLATLSPWRTNTISLVIRFS